LSNTSVKHLLIDAKNMLYRAVYVAAYDKQYKASGHHPINIILHFLNSYLHKFNPEKIHIFWDSPRDSTWRKSLDPCYKDGRGGSKRISDSDVSDAINNLTEVGTHFFRNMGIRQYYKDDMEADDLIYAFCKMNDNDSIVIVSSDTDLKQITYRYKNVKIHSHLSKTKALYELVPNLDPVVFKCLVGDKSDNIYGYYRVGPVKARVLVEDTQRRHEFFESQKAVAKVGNDVELVGDARFKRNLLLIDLSLCPFLLDNMMHVSRSQFKPIKFDLKKIRELISKYKLRGVTADMSRYVTPFKRLIGDPNGCINSLR
jgi:5'-3' exonuclease